MENNEKPKEFKFVEPMLIKAGSDKIMLGAMNPQYPAVDCRVIWEDNYQYLMGIREEHTRLLKENGELKEQLQKMKSLLEEIQIDCDENTIGKLSGSYFDKIGNLLLTVKS